MPRKDLSQMTPPEVDTIIYGYEVEASPFKRERNHILAQIESIRHPRSKGDRYKYEQARRTSTPEYKAAERAQLDARLPGLDAKIAEIQSKAEPYRAEYRRRWWPRYYLVTSSSGGHVHRGQDCSTCHPTTEFVWLVDLAGKSSREMVAQWGDTACTICFPEAPTMPEWQTGTKKREAREAKEGGVCPLSGQIWTQRPDAPPDAPRWPTAAKCQRCGAQIKISPDTRKIRKHNFPKD